jgi:hypothetical protein
MPGEYRRDEIALQLPADLAGQGAATWDIELDLGNGVCLRLRRG